MGICVTRKQKRHYPKNSEANGVFICNRGLKRSRSDAGIKALEKEKPRTRCVSRLSTASVQVCGYHNTKGINALNRLHLCGAVTKSILPSDEPFAARQCGGESVLRCSNLGIMKVKHS